MDWTVQVEEGQVQFFGAGHFEPPLNGPVLPASELGTTSYFILRPMRVKHSEGFLIFTYDVYCGMISALASAVKHFFLIS